MIKGNFWILLLVFVIGMFLAVATPLQRSMNDNPLTPGDETYDHLNNIFNHNFDVYDLIIFSLSGFLSYQFIILFLPLLFLLIMAIFFYLIIRKYVSSDIELYVSLGILFFTPAILNIYLGLTVYSLILLLFLISSYLYLIKSKLYLIFLFLIYLVNPLVGLILLLTALSLSDIGKKKLEFLLILGTLVSSMILTSIVNYFPFLFSKMDFSFSLTSLFNFSGGFYGFVLFTLILGLTYLYSNNNNLFTPYPKLIFSILFLFSLFYEPLRILFLPVIAIFAAKGLTVLIRQEWSISYLKDLTILLFVCMLLFSTLSSIKENSQLMPTVDQKEAYLFLKAVKLQNPDIVSSKVLTSPDYKSQLVYFSNMTAYSTFDDSLSIDLTNNLFTSRDYSYIKEKLKQEKIAFIYVDKLMLQGNVFEKPDQGMLFVMTHNDNFKLIYSKGKDRIYYFTLWNEN